MLKMGMIKVAMKEVVGSYIQCVKSRPAVIFIYTWPAFVSFFIASRSYSQGTMLDVLKLIVAMSLMGFGIYFYNDLTDIQDDLKNSEMGNPAPASRPFGSGKVSEERLKKFILFSLITSLLVGYFININVLGLLFAYMTIGILYSAEPVRLKKRFLLKQLTITVGVTLAVLSGAYTAGGVSMPILYLLILHFIMCMGMNPIMDLRDMRGDRVMGVKSIPVVWGPELTVRLYFVSMVIIGGATLVGYTRMGFNTALPLLVLMILGAWTYVSLPLLQRWDDPKFLHALIFKKMMPIYLVLQLVPLIGLINLPF
jgi:4-hydroxybenzoate polyprenyltransferase